MIKFCLNLWYNLIAEENRETVIATLSGIITSITTASILSVITSILMAFGVGLAGALGGLVAKFLWDYFKKRLRRWF